MPKELPKHELRYDTITEAVDLTTSVFKMEHQGDDPNQRPLHVVFLHLDWGIGGAEQLMLQLADSCNGKTELVTGHCDPRHCFDALKPGMGPWYSHLRVYDPTWLPQDVFGYGRALCSTLRLLYLAYCVCCFEETPDLIVVDVLPTPLWVLRYCTGSALLYYCHFPDQLLTYKKKPGFLRKFYRRIMNGIEARAMHKAHCVCVNSHFTAAMVNRTFPNLRVPLPVIYPTIATPKLDGSLKKQANLIVSINRYERKKNLELLLRAVHWVESRNIPGPTLEVVVAGGYDRNNKENLEYKAELEQLAQKLRLQNCVKFETSITDDRRRQLLQQAAAVIYTPENEHFGIVPLEAMSYKTTVVACRSGGPTETIIDRKTGFLCNPTAADFGGALVVVTRDPDLAVRMGQAGYDHVMKDFGPQRLQREWLDLTRKVYLRHEKSKIGRVVLNVKPVVMTTLVFLGIVFATLLVVFGAYFLPEGDVDEL